jgi:hypothetical protein
MKQFIFRHEKAITRVFAVIHIILQVGLSAVAAIVVLDGIHGALTHISFPLTADNARFFVNIFAILWLTFTGIIFIVTLLKINHIACIQDFINSLLEGFFEVGLFIGMVFSAGDSNSHGDLIVLFVLLALEIIFNDVLSSLYNRAIAHAKREQIRRCLQCFKALVKKCN